MKKNAAICSLIILVSMASLAWGSSDPLPAADLPSISGLLPQQAGADRLSLVVRGTDMPMPEVVGSGPGFLDLFFRDTVIPSSKWSRDYDLPLLKEMSIENVKGGLRLRLVTEEELVVNRIAGVPPSNRYTVDLRAKRAPVQDGPYKKPVKAPVVDPSDPFQTTKNITIDFRDASLQDVFRMVGEMMNLNVLLDPSVAQSSMVTMKFEDAPLKEVFGYLMRSYGLTYAKMGRTLIIGSPEGVSKATGEVRTRGFHVAYADLKALPDSLASLTGVAKERITVDERLRQVFVKASEGQLQKVEDVLQTLDHPGLQVMLRARIIEINDDASDKLEAILNAVYKHWWLSTSPTDGAGGYVYTKDPGYKDTKSPLDLDVTDIGLGTIRLLDSGLKAIVQENKGKILANPSVVTLSGSKASIKLVQKYKYVSGKDDAGNPTYSDEEVGPQLEFTPVVGRDGVISVELAISTGEIINWRSGGRDIEVPETSERNVMTSVRVKDGEPFVVGGLFSERHRTLTTKIPVLGDLPLLGEMFRSSRKEDSRSEVVMVVIPYILGIDEGAVENWNL